MPDKFQKIRIPDPFRKHTNGKESVVVAAENVGEAIVTLWVRFPDLKDKMTDGNGWLRRFVNIYVNEQDIRFLKNQETLLQDGDQITIIPGLIHQSSFIPAVAVANHLRVSQPLD